MSNYVDLQINGYGGIDFSSPDLTMDAIGEVVEALKTRGTELFCPTMITCDSRTYESNLPLLARAIADPSLGEHLAGIHIEGPFLTSESAGAHPRNHLKEPDPDLFKSWQELADGNIRILTLAPELPGAERLIKEASDSGVVVGLGHHMADHESIMRAAENGARLCTHLGNGISNTLPRHPNPIWSQLACDQLTAAFITDGHHLPAEFIRVAWRAKGAGNFIISSDAAPVAGCEPGMYDLWEQQVRVDESGKICVPDGTSLAGSSALMGDCVDFMKTCVDLSQDEVEKISRSNSLELISQPIR